MGLEVHEDSSVCLFDLELSFNASVLFDPYFHVQDWEETCRVWNFQFKLDNRMFAEEGVRRRNILHPFGQLFVINILTVGLSEALVFVFKMRVSSKKSYELLKCDLYNSCISCTLSFV